MVLLLPQHTETPVISCCSAILPAVWRVAAYLHQACRPALAWQRVLPSICCCSSVTKSCPTFCDPRVAALQPLCPLLSHEVCSRSWPLSQWCYLTISSSVIPFSFHFLSFPASGSFPMCQLFTSDGQSIEASTSASVLPWDLQGSFPLALTGLISLKFKRLLRVFSNTTVQMNRAALFITVKNWKQLKYISESMNLQTIWWNYYSTIKRTQHCYTQISKQCWSMIA